VLDKKCQSETVSISLYQHTDRDKKGAVFVGVVSTFLSATVNLRKEWPTERQETNSYKRLHVRFLRPHISLFLNSVGPRI